jgi:hypothetical protein
MRESISRWQHAEPCPSPQVDFKCVVQAGPVMMADDAAFGASHTSFYTSAVAKDSYATIDDILTTKMADEGVREVVTEMLAACVKITEALRVNLVTVADAQNSVFGDVQLGVDVLADRLMWEACKSSKVSTSAPLHTCCFRTRLISRR